MLVGQKCEYENGLGGTLTLMANQVKYRIQKRNLAHSVNVYAVAFSFHLRSPLVAKSTPVWEACISAILLGWVVDHQYIHVSTTDKSCNS
jgi:hypothetical protein